MSRTELVLTPYVNKEGETNSVVLRGPDHKLDATRDFKAEIGFQGLGGKFSPFLTGGPGWMFPLNKEAGVRKWIETGDLEEAKKLFPARKSPAEKKEAIKTSASSLTRRVTQLEAELEAVRTQLAEMRTALGLPVVTVTQGEKKKVKKVAKGGARGSPPREPSEEKEEVQSDDEDPVPLRQPKGKRT